MTKLARKPATSKIAKPSLRDMANAIRALSMDAVDAANSGHPGMPMGMADVATVLFTKALKYDASAPDWPDRDRFVLSAGHGSMLLYALLYLTGAPKVSLNDIKAFRKLGSKTAGHPEHGHAPGIETTTGPLGQGLANAVGMALAERLLNARHGNSLVNHHTYVIAGDGCLMEGISHEAIDLAGHLQLNKLIVLFDDNSISIDGPTDLSTSMNQLERFDAAGWAVTRIDGHDHAEIEAALEAAKKSDRPSLIACRTIIGYGSPNKQGTAGAHGGPLGATENKAARDKLEWTAPAFEIPAPILEAWREAGERGQKAKAKWDATFDGLAPKDKSELNRVLKSKLPSGLAKAVAALKAKWLADKPGTATRVASQTVLEELVGVLPELVGGSADLTGSNGTKAKSQKPVKAGDFSGSYIHYGVREHGMAAAMNGIALHGGFIPYGGTFLVFADYCRPAIRLSALMQQRVIYVMTHDSIGVGEDGPTHQPVEQLASLRAMPNCLVFRPADSVETLEAWHCALQASDRPSILCLTRQNLPALRVEANEDALLATLAEHAADEEPAKRIGGKRHVGAAPAQTPDNNLVARGAYVLHEPKKKRHVTLLATGSEVSLALEAAEKLHEEHNIRAAVVSMPCWELFRQQPKSYQDDVLGKAPRIGIEAAVKAGWHEWLGSDGPFIGMESFGASGAYQELYQHFGITVEAIVAAAKDIVK